MRVQGADLFVFPGGRLFHAFRGAAVASLQLGRTFELQGRYDDAAGWYARAEVDGSITGLQGIEGAAARGLARVARLEADRRVAERELEAEYDAAVERATWGLF